MRCSTSMRCHQQEVLTGRGCSTSREDAPPVGVLHEARVPPPEGGALPAGDATAGRCSCGPKLRATMSQTPELLQQPGAPLAPTCRYFCFRLAHPTTQPEGLSAPPTDPTLGLKSTLAKQAGFIRSVLTMVRVLCGTQGAKVMPPCLAQAILMA